MDVCEHPDRLLTLWAVHEDLVATLDGVHQQLSGLEEFTQHLDISCTLALSERISRSSFAPKNWKEGWPLGNYLSPLPLPEIMRLGVLPFHNLGKNCEEDNNKVEANNLEDEEQATQFIAKLRKVASRSADGTVGKILHKNEGEAGRQQQENEGTAAIEQGENEEINDDEEEEEEGLVVPSSTAGPGFVGVTSSNRDNLASFDFFGGDDDDEDD